MSIPIGVFDSGVGGLSVAKALFDTFENEIIYFADSVHLPYGNKSRKNIIQYSLSNVSLLKAKGAKLIVIACNTSTAIALDRVQQTFNDRHVIGVVKPGAKKAIEFSLKKKIAVIGTLRTIESKVYEKELKTLDSNVQVWQKACPLLVPIIEEGFKNKEIIRSVINEYLKDFVHSIDTLILGCTHYPLLKDTISSMYPWLRVVDSAEATAVAVAALAEEKGLHFKKNACDDGKDAVDLENGLEKKKKLRIYTNDVNEVFERLSHYFFPGYCIELL